LRRTVPFFTFNLLYEEFQVILVDKYMGTWGGQVFNEGQLIFFVASRGHHAEIGGITPGSMPPFSKAIWEEGAAIKAFKLVEGGVFQEEEIIRILKAEKTDTEVEAGSNGVRVIPGTRRIEDNLSDLRAQVAANQRGIVLIGELIEQYGLEVVQAYMVHVQANAEAAVREMLKTMATRASALQSGSSNDEKLVVLEAEDYMDDGSAICLKLTIDSVKGEAHFDFGGTSPEVRAILFQCVDHVKFSLWNFLNIIIRWACKL
jgi:5-oxoprolinase (ATP-hydrolysing)